MKSFIPEIPIPNLLLSLIPVGIVFFIYLKWSLPSKQILYATLRMFVQLILIGYLLVFIFDQKNPYFMSGVLLFMLMVAAWISLHHVTHLRVQLYGWAFLSLALGSLPPLLLMVMGILSLDPWYEPKYLIPLGGMVIANAMNCISVGAERVVSEQSKGTSFDQSKAVALKAGLIPLTNNFFAVGLVSLPGIMTGQILSGVSPLVAVRYQIMIMCIILGAGGLSAALFLTFLQKKLSKNTP